MKKKSKKVLIIIILLISTIIFIKYFGDRLFVTTTKADRDISLALYNFEYPTMSAKEFADNFLMGYYKSGTENFDASVINTPHTHFARTTTYNVVCDYSKEQLAYTNAHENWFAHAKGTDWNNPDNRCHSTGYNEYSMDITNAEYKQYAIALLVNCSKKPGANGVLIDLVYSQFRDCGFIIKRAERVVTADGLTVTVNNTLTPYRLVGGYIFPILITTDQNQNGTNKYGGYYANKTINLVASDWVLRSTNGQLETVSQCINCPNYPQDMKPKDFEVGYNTTLTRVTGGFNSTYAWSMKVLSADNDWKRRITSNAATQDVGYNGTAHFNAWFKNVGNATQVCVQMEKRAPNGVSYGSIGNCYSNPVIGEWVNLDIVYRLPTTTDCGGVACTKITPWLWVKTMNGSTAEIIVDNFVWESYVGKVSPGTTLYVTYGATGYVPDETAPYYKDFHTSMMQWLRDIRVALPAGKYLLFNEMEGSGNADYAPLVDGAQEEGFVRAYWNVNNNEANVADWTGTGWENAMKIINDSWEAPKKINAYCCGTYKNPTTAFTQRVFDFCFPSFLLISEKGRNAFAFTGYDNDVLEWYRKEYDYKYGTPLNDYHIYYQGSNYKIYGRDFTNSLVLVNPFRVNVNVSLPRTYYTIEGVAVDSVFMTNVSGVILFNKVEEKKVDWALYIIIGIAIIGIILYMKNGKKKRR